MKLIKIMKAPTARRADLLMPGRQPRLPANPGVASDLTENAAESDGEPTVTSHEDPRPVKCQHSLATRIGEAPPA